MEDLIKALQILLKYGDTKFPTHCEHDEFMIYAIDPSIVSDEDKKELEKLSFSEEKDHFYSYRYGSC